MPVTEIGDPRLQALFGSGDLHDPGVRPTVRLPAKGVPPVVAGILILLAGALLFALLNARRTAGSEPAVRGRSSEVTPGTWAAPPPLYIPPAPVPVTVVPFKQASRPAVLAAPVPVLPVQRPAVSSPVYMPQPLAQMAPPAVPPPQRASAGSALVIDAGNGQADPAAASPLAGDTEGGPGLAPAGRMRASALANRSMTVPQGYLIPAVLETGFDSTKPGYARAIVSRDVRGFDGNTILIPRGSRLIGAYRSAISQGQNRAVIGWTRLIRPDGMTIAMDAPSVDTLGRGGIRAHVDTHFFGRLGDALLQSTVQLGQAIAGRSSGSVVVVGNGVAAAAPQLTTGTGYQPTLTVAPGRSISVFVAHDLDFSAAGPAR